MATAPLVAQGPPQPLVDHFLHAESAHVHPLDMTPDGSTLLAVNTPDARVEIFDLTGALPVWVGSVQVGLSPVTVRARDNNTAWVCNHISDSISIVDIGSRAVVETIQTGDEPSDVVFDPGTTSLPPRAWVSLSQPDTIEVYDTRFPQNAPTRIPLIGQDPRSMILAPDGLIYVGIFMSANNTTVLNGSDERWAKNVVSDPTGPYGGTNPPPNNGPTAFSPPLATGAQALPPAPPVSLIVRKDFNNQWLDDNMATPGNWTSFVRGGNHDRKANWDMYDHDIAVIDPNTAAVVGYIKRAMNIVANIAVRPVVPPEGGGPTFAISAVGTEATNEVRFEPNLKSTFVRAHYAEAAPWPTTNANGPVDLNAYLTTGAQPLPGKNYWQYATREVPQNLRDAAIGDPRFHVWDSTGFYGFVSGMGSNNVIVIDSTGARLPGTLPIEVGEGPTGLVLDEAKGQLYVLNKFSGSLSVVAAGGVVTELPFHDPTPLAVKAGRKHLFDTHKGSGLGQVACASCHVDADLDGLGWDLGNPAGQAKAVHGPNINGLGQFVPGANTTVADATQRYHPMKGPMVTQSLRDIIGKEPFHWRGDKKGLEEFNGAFHELQGDDASLSAAEMAEAKEYLKSLWYPPNPLRNPDNTFEATTVMDGTHPDLPGVVFRHHAAIPTFPPPPPPLPPPAVLPPGSATAAFSLSAPGGGHYSKICLLCHTASTGTGPDKIWNGTLNLWQQLAAGTYGEAHTAMITTDGTSQVPMKIPNLRNIHERTGFDMTALTSKAGFGLLHDGHIDTMARFLKPFELNGLPLQPQETADMVAFMLQFSSNITYPTGNTALGAPTGPPARNMHPAVGLQWTVTTNPMSTLDQAKYNQLAQVLTVDAANPWDTPQLGAIAKQNLPGGGQRGYVYIAPNYVDDQGTLISPTALLNTVAPGQEVTFTLVHKKTELRFGIDRDADGWPDGVEVTLNTRPDSARSIPPAVGTPCGMTTAPPAVTGVAVAAVGVYGNGVSWSIPAGSNHSGFAVERMLANSPQWETLAELGPTITTYADQTVSAATQYVYRVRSYNCFGEALSATATHNSYLPPLAPMPVHLHAIDLQWATEIVGGTTQRFAYGTFHVVDEENRAVRGARVSGRITGASGVKTGGTWGLPAVAPMGATFVAETNAEGQAYFRSTPITTTGTVTWTFHLDNIDTAASGTPAVSYDQSANKVAITASVTAQ